MIWWKSLKCSKKLLRDGLVLGRIGEAKSDGGGFSNGENTWTPPSLTSLIYLFLLGDFNLPEVPFPDHWCEVSPLPEAPVGSPVIIGRCCFCSSTDSKYCFFLLLLLISTRSSTDLLDIGLSAKMHNLPYQFIWILFNHHDLKLCKRELSVLVLVGELEHLIDVGLGHRHR